MPRVISTEKRKLLDDPDWLRDMHVSQLFSVTELAKLIGVTPATVTKALRQHGIDTPSQQMLREAALIRKYGVTNVSHIPGVRVKALNTMVSKFGGHNWSNVVDQSQRRATCLARYGDTNPGRTDYCKDKAVQTNLLKYGRIHKNQHHLSDQCFNNLCDKDWLFDQHVVQQKTQLQIATELGFTHNTPTNTSTVSRAMAKHDIAVQSFQRSFEETQLADFVRSLGVDVVTNSRSVIAPQELDIYIPQHGLAIEYCGIYWHSERFRNPKYHVDKLNSCTAAGIRLLTIFSDEWINSPSIVKAKISAILGMQSQRVYARQCEIREITRSVRKEFLDLYHIQHDGPGSVTYGLFHHNCLVSVMTLIKQSNGRWVLNRFASSVRVVGGFSKLLFHFQKSHDWLEIVSFADRRWSVGRVYEATGFLLDRVLPPDYYWVYGNTRYHKFNYRHSQMKNKLVNYDDTLSETENMIAHGFVKLWNCGLLRYVLHTK